MTLDIMLPFYGRVDHMKIAVNSILAQRSGSWRLVVVDDGVPDESLAGWFRSLDDERVEYRRNSNRLGAAGNFSRCLELVESEWFVMMGADDVMLPGYVDRITELAAIFPEAGFIHPGVEVIDENGALWMPLVERAKAFYRPRISDRTEYLTGEHLARSLVRGDWMYFPSICWRTYTVRPIGFRPGLAVAQDLALSLDVVMRGPGMVLDTDVMFQYRRHTQSDSSWRAAEGTRFIEERVFLGTVAAELDAIGWHRAARNARFRLSSRVHALTFVPKALKARNWEGTRTLIRCAVGHWR